MVSSKPYWIWLEPAVILSGNSHVFRRYLGFHLLLVAVFFVLTWKREGKFPGWFKSADMMLMLMLICSLSLWPSTSSYSLIHGGTLVLVLIEKEIWFTELVTHMIHVCRENSWYFWSTWVILWWKKKNEYLMMLVS